MEVIRTPGNLIYLNKIEVIFQECVLHLSYRFREWRLNLRFFIYPFLNPGICDMNVGICKIIDACWLIYALKI